MKTLNRKNWLAGGAAVVLTAGVLSPSFALFDKTRFALHMGEAFFAFHHFVYNPYKAGKFEANTPGRTKTLIKGGAALLFAAHEVKVSSNIAHKSKSPLLQKLAGSLDSLEGEWTTLSDKVKNGTFRPSDIDAANAHTAAAGAGAAAAGIPVKEKQPDAPIAGTEDQ